MAVHRISRLTALPLILLLLGALGVVEASQARAGDPGTTPGVEHMHDYSAAQFSAQAQQLPADMVDAIQRDLGISAEQYLADSAAALQAVRVVDDLRGAGVAVLGSRIDGTKLTVNVANAKDAALVQSAGGSAQLGAPVTPNHPDRKASFAEDIYGGEGYAWTDSTYIYQCSIGFNGYETSGGNPQFTTAGHCVNSMAGIVGSVHSLTFTSPQSVSGSSPTGASIGLPVAGTLKFPTTDSGYDVGRVAVSNSSVTPKASVLTWNKGAGAPLGTTPRLVTGYSAAITGANLCKSGSRSGWQCGPVTRVDWEENVGGTGLVNSIEADVCVLAGDSGGSAVIGSAAVGITSFSEQAGGSSCLPRHLDTPDGINGDYWAGFFPMDSSSAESVQSAYGSTWEIAATVPTPVVTTPVATINDLTTIAGTLDSGTAPNKVQLYIDGSPTASANVSAADGTWTAPIPSLTTGLHSYRVAATYGQYSTSAGSATGWFKVGFTSDRLAGGDRFATSTAIMNAAYAPNVPVLYVTTGFNYPDALSAGPAAAHKGGPVLLVPPTVIGATELAAITAINPAKIIVLGGSNGVSNTVFAQLQAIQANTVRIAGTDRYDTSRLISRDAFIGASETGATHVFISNGGNFPDALSAGGAAASVNGAVVLVNGAASTVPAATLQLLTDLGATDITITGSAASVSAGIETQLSGLGYTVQRLGGANRYETSQLINNAFFSPVQSQVYIASGQNFPDALGGAALAGAKHAPLFTAPKDCVPAGTLTEIARLQSPHATLFGDTNTLSTNVGNLVSC